MKHWLKAMSPTARAVAIIACVALLAIGGTAIFSGMKGKNPLEPTPTSIVQAAIPPIDTVQPAQTETATFSLG